MADMVTMVDGTDGAGTTTGITAMVDAGVTTGITAMVDAGITAMVDAGTTAMVDAGITEMKCTFIIITDITMNITIIIIVDKKK
jgi:hypothetical protein